MFGNAGPNDTVTQFRTLTDFRVMLARGVGKSCRDIGAKTWALENIAAPALRGALALPDYHTSRPSEADAIAYAKRLFETCGDSWDCDPIRYAYCLGSPADAPNAVDVRVVFGGRGGAYTVTVWYENGELYGEW